MDDYHCHTSYNVVIISFYINASLCICLQVSQTQYLCTDL